MGRLVPLLLAAMLAVLSGCGGDDSATTAASPAATAAAADASGPLIVLAAASLTEAFEQYGPQFDGGQVRFSFAGSDELAAQIRQGVTPDVFASANTDLPAQLHQEGLVGGPAEFAANRLVLAVPADSAATSAASTTSRQSGRDASPSAPRPSRSGPTRATCSDGSRRRASKAILANVRSSEPDVKGIVGKLDAGRRRRRLRLRHRRGRDQRRAEGDRPARRSASPGRLRRSPSSTGARSPAGRPALHRRRRAPGRRQALSAAGFGRADVSASRGGSPAVLFAALAVALAFLVLPVVAIFADTSPGRAAAQPRRPGRRARRCG